MYVFYDKIQTENIDTGIFKFYWVKLLEMQTNVSGFEIYNIKQYVMKYSKSKAILFAHFLLYCVNKEV